jgi:hypothetical protein
VTPLELAAAAQANVARVITLLERPTVSALDQSAAELAVAISRVEGIQGEIAGAPVQVVMIALRKDLGRAGRLLRNAWELRIGRSSQIEYTTKGEWVRPPSTIRWAIEA